jgi:ABC-type sugar transport system, periplasmic component
MHSPVKRNVLLAAALTVPFLSVTALCALKNLFGLSHRYGRENRVGDLEKTFGAVPAPKKPLHFVYVTKTLINEFWQDVSAGIKSEAAKYNIKVDVQAPKDESSLVEQLNLAQTLLSQKPDALLLSPQSDSNMVPVSKRGQEA